MTPTHSLKRAIAAFDPRVSGDGGLRLGLAIVLCLYAAIYGGLLIATGGLPYVFDNNETFSSMVHANSLLTYGFDKTFGLTDESYGRTALSHPYVYTHQGNLPRFFAALIDLLGARSVEAQIVVTTFTVGLIGVLLAYDLVAKRAGWLFGVFFCALTMTDYLMVAQWQIVTWRVWHIFFFFLSLWCVDRIAARPERTARWLFAGFVVHAALFYFEIAFGMFTAATAAIFAIIRFHRRVLTAAAFIAAQGAGLLVGLGALIGQLIAYFGWENFLTDIRLTYVARNEALQDSARSALEEFVLKHHVVFWYNVNELTGLRQAGTFFESFFTYALGTYTPVLVSIALVACTAVIAHGLSSFYERRRRKPTTFTMDAESAQLVVVGIYGVYAFYIIGDFSSSGLPDLNRLSLRPLVFLSLAAFLFGSNLVAMMQRRTIDDRLPVAAVMPPVIALIAALSGVVASEGLYGKTSGFWVDAAHLIGVGTLQLAALFAGWTVMRISSPLFAGAELSQAIQRLCRLLSIPISGLIAFTIVYMLIPGYVLTGYLQRYAPLTTYAELMLFAIGAGAMGLTLRDELRSVRNRPWWRALWQKPSARGGRLRPLPGPAAFDSVFAIAGLASLLVLPCYWLLIQGLYFDRVPPDHAMFLKKLAEPAFSGHSFVVNTYAAPIAIQTKQWAYYDPAIAELRVVEVEGAPFLTRDYRYLWLNDRDSNPDYLRPEYFVCFLQQGMRHTAQPALYMNNGCSHLPIVKKAGQTIDGLLSIQMVAKDETGRDRWTILHLDWDERCLKTDCSFPSK